MVGNRRTDSIGILVLSIWILGTQDVTAFVSALRLGSRKSFSGARYRISCSFLPQLTLCLMILSNLPLLAMTANLGPGARRVH
jgi:hypothetical protein